MNRHPSIYYVEKAEDLREYFSIGQRLPKDELQGTIDDPCADCPKVFIQEIMMSECYKVKVLSDAEGEDLIIEVSHDPEEVRIPIEPFVAGVAEYFITLTRCKRKGCGVVMVEEKP